MKSILGIGNALTDILAVLPDDSLLRKYHLPLGSMQHVDMETGDRIWEALKEYGVKYVPGGSAANTITCSWEKSATTPWATSSKAPWSSTA